ncbi:MAG: hypothetical protein OEV06_04420 [Anaerolineae bacterium]|nr:hypothetical protein [Anaerolineae bacterium]
MTAFAVENLAIFGNLIAIILSVFVLLYAFGDSPVFRLAIHIFIGVAAGYAAGIVWHSVVVPQLFAPMVALEASGLTPLDMLLRVVLVVLLLTKLSPRTARFGNPASAYLVGIGAAVAVGGAVRGTLFPLASSYNGFFAMLGTVATLIYFHFGARSAGQQPPRRNRIIEIIAVAGKVFITVTFAAMFAGVFLASLVALVERLHFIWTNLSTLLFG